MDALSVIRVNCMIWDGYWDTARIWELGRGFDANWCFASVALGLRYHGVYGDILVRI